MKKVFIHDISDTTEHKFVKPAKLAKYTVGNKFGKTHFWELMTEPKDTVHVLVLDTSSSSILLVKQVRIPVLVNQPNIENGEVIEACAGIIDKYANDGLSDLDRARAIAVDEVHEELGYQINSSMLNTLPYMLSNVGMIGSINYPFFCTVDDSLFVGQSLQDGEDIDIIKLDASKASILTFLSTENRTDAITKYLLQWFLINYDVIVD